uniref:RRM domain-containing protein n=1 Tax=Kalanchoe fedtschenkoi TaxID=63787 RepID=A0A7N0UK00_KALFE
MALLHSLCFTPTTPFQSPSSFSQRPSSSPLSAPSLSVSSVSISKTLLLKSTKLQSFLLYCSPSATATAEEVKEDEGGAAAAAADGGGGGSRLIAQNVPWSCTADDVRALFEKHGTVVDVELSMHNKTRNRGLAFVTMGSPEEALAALKNLEALEYEGRTLKIAYAKSLKKQRQPTPAAKPKPVSPYNLFIGNLSYEARAKDLRELFSSEGAKVVSAEVIFQENPRRASGYGFVSFSTKEAAEAALTTFDGKMLFERPIRVSLSKRFAKKVVKPKPEAQVESAISPDAGAAET